LFFALCSTVTLDEVAAVIKPFVSLYVASGQALSVLYRLLRAEVESTSTSQRSAARSTAHLTIGPPPIMQALLDSLSHHHPSLVMAAIASR